MELLVGFKPTSLAYLLYHVPTFYAIGNGFKDFTTLPTQVVRHYFAPSPPPLLPDGNGPPTVPRLKLHSFV